MKSKERPELPEVFVRLRTGKTVVSCGNGTPQEPNPLEPDFPAICDGDCQSEGSEGSECLVSCPKLP